MPKHEFGILPRDPDKRRRFETYAPEKYDCISVDDESIQPLLQALQQVKTYSHSLQRPGSGLEYCGITLIPPDSLEDFLQICQTCPDPGLKPLVNKLLQALGQRRYVIHYGI